MERDCWLSPYGEVINCTGKWDHAGTAWKIMEEKLGLDLDEIDKLDREHGSLTAATGGYDDIGWVIKDKFEPTEDQKRKMFDLTGFIYS